MPVESGFCRPAAVLLLTQSRYRHDHYSPAPRLLPDAATHLEAIELGKTDVEQYQIGTQSVDGFHGLDTIVRHVGLVPDHRQQPGQRLRRVDVVVDDQNPARGGERWTGRRHPIFGAFQLQHRQPHHEFGTTVRTGAVDFDPALVHLHETLHEGEADPEPSLGTLEWYIDLGEQFEHTLQLIRRDADTGIADSHDGVVFLPGDIHPDLAPRRRVLARVVEHVAEDLRQTHRIGVHVDRIGRDIDANAKI